MPPLRIALIGCGGIGGKHAEYLASLPDQVELTAFVDPIVQRASEMASRRGSPQAMVFSRHQEMFTAFKPDAVVICIPPYAHTDEVDEAARRGIPVFIEKPIALRVEKAWEMVDAVEKAGIVTQVGFMYRFGAVTRRVKELIASGQAGQPGLMSARYFCNSLHSEWWRSKDKSGGQVFEQAIHMIDLMRYLLGDAATAYSLQNNMFHQDVPDYTVEDVSGTIYGFKSGAVGILYASNGAIPHRWEYDFRLVARNLTVQADDANHALLTYTSGAELKTEAVASEQDVYAMEMDEFLAAIRSGTSATTTPMREGALTLAMASAAMRSAETHREEML
jgi:predicted dehydrogenase